MTAYVEQLRRSEKRLNLIEGSLQIVRPLLSNDQAHRKRLTSFVDLPSDVLLLRIFHHDLLLALCRHGAELGFSTMISFNDHENHTAHSKAASRSDRTQVAELDGCGQFFPDYLPSGISANSAACIPDTPPERGRTLR